MSEAWFVRRFPLDNPRKSMAPANWKGWATMVVFTGAMTVAGLAFLLFALTGSFVPGLIVFALIGGVAGYGLLWIVKKKGDPTKVAKQPPPLPTVTLKIPTPKSAPKPEPVKSEPVAEKAAEPVSETPVS